MKFRFPFIVLFFLGLAGSFLFAAAEKDGPARGNLVQNPDFRDGLKGWTQEAKEDPAGKLQASVEERRGQRALRMTFEPPASNGWPQFFQTLKLAPGKTYAVTLDVDAENTGGGAGPYYCLDYLDASGKRIALATGVPILREGSWNACSLNVVVPPDAVSTRLQLILHGYGTAWWHNIRVEEIGKASTQPHGRVTGKLAAPNPRPLVGIGFEDDGYAYAERNLSQGITPEELRLREERIRFLQGDFVRMFVSLSEWLPQNFFSTMPEPEPLWKGSRTTDGWRSILKTLGQYQALGTTVNVTGQEFGGRAYLGPIWQDAAKIARLYGDLLAYLIKEKGFTCIRYFTLDNEPDATFMTMSGGTFETYVTVHRLLREELRKRKIPVTLVGSDDANSYRFITRCVESAEMRASVGAWSSHLYIVDYPLNHRNVAEMFAARMDLIDRLAPRTDLFIGEYGFAAEGKAPSADNPLMQTYDYALHNTDFVLTGLSRGVTGFSLWVLHQVYYPAVACADLMFWGTWGYRTRLGEVFPVFHSVANLTRHTKPGDRVTPLVLDGEKVSACKVGDHIFWVNLRETPVTFRVEGVPLLENHAYTEATLSGEQECGKVERVEDNTCELPPRSFGRIKVDIAKK